MLPGDVCLWLIGDLGGRYLVSELSAPRQTIVIDSSNASSAVSDWLVSNSSIVGQSVAS